MKLVKALFVLIGFFNTAMAEELPQYSAPVMDQVGVLSGPVQTECDSLLSRLYRSGGPQIGVLIVPSLNGSSIEEYSIKLAETWKLGRAEKDDGVILLVSVRDHKFRIEVGRGLEGDLTDLDSHRIQEEMKPLLAQAKFDEAIYLGVNRIIEKTSKDNNLKQEASDNLSNIKLWVSIAGLIVLIWLISFLITKDPIFIFYIIFNLIGSSSRDHDEGGGGGFAGGGSSDNF